jgi:hypothetical protein
MRGNQVVVVRVDGEMVEALTRRSRQVEFCYLFERLAGSNRCQQSCDDEGSTPQETNTEHIFLSYSSQTIHTHPYFTVMPTIPAPRIYVNLPDSRKIAVLDRDKRAIVATRPLGMALANYPMALDQTDHRLFVITRHLPQLLVFDTSAAKIVQRLSAVGDCDDVFYDQSRKRIYGSGGDGAISVFEQRDADHYQESARITTIKGARTSFFFSRPRSSIFGGAPPGNTNG